MTVKSRTIQNGRIAIIEVKGSLIGDQDTDQFRREVSDFIEQGNKSLIVNMQKVNYMNSSGIWSYHRRSYIIQKEWWGSEAGGSE